MTSRRHMNLDSWDSLAERNEFEPAVPFLNFLTTTLCDGFA